MPFLTVDELLPFPNAYLHPVSDVPGSLLFPDDPATCCTDWKGDSLIGSRKRIE